MTEAEAAAKLQRAWLETEAERYRLMALQRKAYGRLRLASCLLGLAFVTLIWARLPRRLMNHG